MPTGHYEFAIILNNFRKRIGLTAKIPYSVGKLTKQKRLNGMTKEHAKDLLKKQAIGFAITGTLNTLLMFVLYVALNRIMNYQYSYFIAYCISVIALYFMNAWFVFKTSFTWSGFLKFPLIYALQYVVGAFSLEFIVRLGFPVDFAPILVILVLLPVTFVLNRWVLIKKSASPHD